MTMYRVIEKAITNLASKSPVIIIGGPSGYGKKEVAKKLFPNKKVVSFENDYIRKLAEKSPKTFLLAFPDGLIIVEALRVKGILEAIEYYVNLWGFSPARYVLTSSYKFLNKFPADKEDSPFASIILTGFSVDELIKLKKASDNPFEVLFNGQHPRLLTEKYSPKQAVEEIISSSMNHPERKINVSNEANFRKFLVSCARASGQSLSMNQIAKHTGISAPTAKTWLTILQELGFASLVPCEDKTPIFFLHDTGATCSLLGLSSPSSVILDPHRDSLVTAFALGELMRERLLRNLDLHITAVIDNNNQQLFIAKWSKKYEIKICPQVEVTDGYFVWRKTTLKKIILHLGDVTYTNKGIDCISWRDWQKFACELDYFS